MRAVQARERASGVDKCVNSCACPRGAESCPPRPSFSPSVSLFLARSVFPGYRSRFPPSSLFSNHLKSRRRNRPSLVHRPPDPTSLVQLAPKMKFAALAAAAALFGASTVSASAAVHGHQDVALHRRGADRIQRLTKRASLSLSRSFLFRAHATDGRVFKHSRSSRTRNKGF